MILLDINETHGLALVCNDEQTETKYVPLAEVNPLALVDRPGYLLKQHHYVARAHANKSFPIVDYVDPMLPGWKRWDAYAAMWEKP